MFDFGNFTQHSEDLASLRPLFHFDPFLCCNLGPIESLVWICWGFCGFLNGFKTVHRRYFERFPTLIRFLTGFDYLAVIGLAGYRCLSYLSLFAQTPWIFHQAIILKVPCRLVTCFLHFKLIIRLFAADRSP